MDSMPAASYQYINVVPYSNLMNWSVNYHLERDHGYNEEYKLVKIGSVISRNREKVELQDEELYTQVTIKLWGKGVVERTKKYGKEIGTKNQYRVSEGQFIMSKIDARNGAFGIVPSELEGAITTQDFLSYNINTDKAHPKFLKILTTTDQFLKICQSASTGTTGRRRIDEKFFLSIPIPLPSLDEQEDIVQAYNDRVNEAEIQIKKADTLLTSNDSYLLNSLGIIYPSKEIEKSVIRLVPFSKIKRWDAKFLIADIVNFSSKYQLVELDDLITAFNKDALGNSLRFESYKYPSDFFQYIGMEHIRKETGELTEVVNVNGKDIKSQTLQVPTGYIIYGKLRPYLNKYWLNKGNQGVICSSEFFVFNIDQNQVRKDYFLLALASEFVQKQIADKMSGARMPRINTGIFCSIKIPIPPKDIQKRISSFIYSQKEEAQQLLLAAIKNKSASLSDFESQIFKS